MLIEIGYNIAVRFSVPTAVIFVLRVHPARRNDLVAPENFRVEPDLPVEGYIDGFGNHCGRVNSPAGVTRFEILVHSKPVPPIDPGRHSCAKYGDIQGGTWRTACSSA
jgi:hypothetical protein